MTTDITRRRLVRGAAWSAPVIALAATAPAYAASVVTCAPSGYKYPGDGPHTKDYAVSLNCTGGQAVTAVTIDGQPAEQTAPGTWAIANQTDSESGLWVTVTTTDGGTWSGNVKFKPATR